MTAEELKKEPLRRSDWLRHIALGIVAYRAKVRGRADMIAVCHTHVQGGKEIRINVNLSDVSRVKRAGKMQGSNLILCHCPDYDGGCGLKIRVTRMWLAFGTPRCFNKKCPTFSAHDDTGRELLVELGETGDGKLGVDRGERVRAANQGGATIQDFGTALPAEMDDDDLESAFNREKSNAK